MIDVSRKLNRHSGTHILPQLSQRSFGVGRRCGLEPLESRRLLALAVTGVQLNGTEWTEETRAYFADNGLGDGAFSIGDAGQQSIPVGLGGANQIWVTFSEPLNTTNLQGALQIDGAENSYQITGFEYDAATRTAQWTLVEPLGIDFLTIGLDASQVRNTRGDMLDGEWTNGESSFPSGDGANGGDFSFRINVLPGDTNRDGRVNLTDFTALKDSFGGAQPGIAGDVNGDTVVDLNDFNGLKTNFGREIDPGSTLLSAFDLGVLTEQRQLVNEVGPRVFGGDDRIDVYKFTLLDHQSITATLSDRTDSIRFWLVHDRSANGILDPNETLEFNRSGNNSNIQVAEDLVPGTYYLQVVSGWDDSYTDSRTSYTLTLAGQPIEVTNPSDPGSSLATATDLSVLNDVVTRVDVVGASDRVDVYRFTLANHQSVTATLSGRTEDSRFWLVHDRNSNGILDPNETLEFNRSGNSSNIQVAEDLVPGTYYLQIASGWDDSYTDSSTRYTLTLAGQPIEVTNPSDPGSSLATATDLSVLNGVVTRVDVVGGSDRIDVYRFTLANHQSVTATLSDRTEDSRLWLVHDRNSNGILDPNETLEFNRSGNSSNIQVAEDLVPGTYYLQIASGWDDSYTDSSTRYTLTLAGQPIEVTNPSDPGSGFAVATDLGILNGVISRVDVVGGSDPVDVYRFSVTGSLAITATLAERTEDIRLWLVQDTNGNRRFDNGEARQFNRSGNSSNVQVTDELGTGVYYLWVASGWDDSYTDSSTKYTLTLSGVAQLAALEAAFADLETLE